MKTLFIILYSCLSMLNHPLHISVMNIDQDKTDMAFVVTMKFFSDDLNIILAGKREQDTDWAAVLQKYISDKVVLKINNKIISEISDMTRIAEDDAVWISYRVAVSEKIQKIEIKNTVLFDVYYDQTNMLMLTCGGRDYAKKLDVHDAVLTVHFN